MLHKGRDERRFDNYFRQIQVLMEKTYPAGRKLKSKKPKEARAVSPL
jgi:hypothetical protein